ncbi:MAG: ATP-binding protein [Acidimicrobiales bacterium]
MRMRAGEGSADERLQRLLELQSLLAGVARDIGPALQLAPVLHTVLAAMRKLVDFRGGTIQLLDERGLYIAAADPAVSAEVLATRLPVGSGLGGRVIASGQVIYSPDLDGDDRVDQGLRSTGSNADMKSYLAVPLIVLGEIIGVLQVDSTEIDAFSEEDLATLEGLTTHVAGSIESARHHEQVQGLDQLKTDFVARVSHELRTPLTIMAGFTDTLIAHGHRLEPERVQEVLGRIRGSVDRLTRLIEDILTVSSLEAGATKAEPVRVDLAPLLRRVAETSLDKARVTILTDGPKSGTTDVRVTRHILGLLIDNALKYGGDAEVSASREGADLVFSVRDHGPGIRTDDREQAFHRFWRGTHTGSGMGLGLSVCRQLARALGGRVEYSDAEGGGALLRLILPQP